MPEALAMPSPQWAMWGCIGVFQLLCVHTVPILLICLGFLLPDINDEARLGLKWGGGALIIAIWCLLCCVLGCAVAQGIAATKLSPAQQS